MGNSILDSPGRVGHNSPNGNNENHWNVVGGRFMRGGPPRGGFRLGLTMALQAYFDDSGKFDSPVMVLCGFLSTDQRWIAFCLKWRDLLERHGFEYVRMAEFYSQCRARGWTAAKAEAILAEFIDVIRQNVGGAFGIGVDREYFDRKFQIAGLPRHDPRRFLVRHLVRLVRKRIVDWGYPGKVAIVFDDDQSFGDKCYRIVSGLRRDDAEMREAVASIAFADDKWFYPLQAADILASLANAYFREVIAKRRPEIPSLMKRLIIPADPADPTFYASEGWDEDEIDRRWNEIKSEPA